MPCCAFGVALPGKMAEVSPYEAARLAAIAKNRDKLRLLGLPAGSPSSDLQPRGPAVRVRGLKGRLASHLAFYDCASFGERYAT